MRDRNCILIGSKFLLVDFKKEGLFYMIKGKKKISVNDKSSFVFPEVLSVSDLSVVRDLRNDIPDFIDIEDFMIFRKYSHALVIANNRLIVNPATSFYNRFKSGAYNDQSDDDINSMKKDCANRCKLWVDQPRASLLQLCRNSIDLLDINDSIDRESYDEIHLSFKEITGYDFNEIYVYMNNLSRKIVVQPDISSAEAVSDHSDWQYKDWMNVAIKDCWGNSEGIDLLTLYSRIEKLLPSERTNSFFDSYMI